MGIVNINKTVDNVIDTYMREDYDFMVKAAQEGREIPKHGMSINEVVDFIVRNKLQAGRMTDWELKQAAWESLVEIGIIEEQILKEYYEE